MSDTGPTGSGTVTANRSQALADTFVALADTLVADFDVVDLLDTLVASCVGILDVSAAGLLVDDQRGHQAVLAATSNEIHHLEMLQLQNDEGPGLECFRTGLAVVTPDMAAEAHRWPRFAAATIGAGFRCVAALPLRIRAETIGSLTLFHRKLDAIKIEDLTVAQALADVATIAIIQQRALHRSEVLAEQLQQALSSRIVIEQAKGVLAERLHLDMDRSFELLREISQRNNIKLTEAAARIVGGDATTLSQLLLPSHKG